MLWYICKTFGILPNDPLFRNLTSLQVIWIIENMVEDAKESERAFKGSDVKVFESDIDVEELARLYKR